MKKNVEKALTLLHHNNAICLWQITLLWWKESTVFNTLVHSCNLFMLEVLHLTILHLKRWDPQRRLHTSLLKRYIFTRRLNIVAASMRSFFGDKISTSETNEHFFIIFQKL